MHPAAADSGARAATWRANDEDGRTSGLNISLAQGTRGTVIIQVFSYVEVPPGEAGFTVK